MNKHIKYTIWVVIVAAVAGLSWFLLSGQGKSSDTLNEVAIQDLPYTYSSTKAQTASEFNMLALTAATPLALDRNGHLKEYAAKEVKVSNQNQKVTITLKDGLKYEDGSNVSAQDYKTSINLLANPNSKASYASWATDWIVGAKDVFENKTKEVSGVKVLSKNKYEINLTGKYGFFKSTLSSGIWAPLKKEWVEKIGLNNFGNNYKHVLSSGEYKIKKLQKDQYLEYEKIGNKVLSSQNTPQHVKFKMYTTPSAIANDFKAKKVNSVAKSEVADKILKYSKNKQADDVTEDPVMMVLANGGIAKQNMQALYLAIDKKYFIDNYYYGLGQVRDSLAPKSYDIEGQNFNRNQNNYDLQKAKSLLTNDFKTVKLQVKTGLPAAQESGVKYLVNQWTKLGLKVEVVKKPFGPNDGTMGSNSKVRDYDVTIGLWGADYSHPNTFYGSLLGSETGTGYSYWVGGRIKEYDSVVKQANEESNVKIADQLFQKAYEIQKEEGQLFPLLQKQSSRYIQPNGWEVHGNGHVLQPAFWVKNK